MRLTPILMSAAILAACGSGNEARYLIDPPAVSAERPARVATVEMRDVSLPAYASAVEISRLEADGALRNLPDSLWADDPVRGVTHALARSLDAASRATVAAEPWPLSDPAQAVVDVRIERLVARADGKLELAAQYAIASPDGLIRERIGRFQTTVEMGGEGPDAIAAAAGQAIAELADRLAEELSR
ncbi:hypothetical protein LV82_02094 [Albidovulum inexpectatum]|uniref:ABC-type transport auxiliary lipoprotein component domain-containing protein n=1 Tax=Albidovulum inexpectatum TaxID=196587 RepID=A0A2S5JFF4_9RHOB|nr:ABC-type transport auxiliary lipoprotein family protein [Albidovulum inexpectatum]PPB80222.1 hypothetical protein LV82_02094 [Albidovulum inexpectatum]